MRKLLLNTALSALFLTAPLLASEDMGGDFAHMSSPSGNQAEHEINFHEIVKNLPADVGKLVSSHMEKDSFESFRQISKAYADLGFEKDALLARKAIFVIKDRKDLPAFAQMMKERNLYNIPIKIKDMYITDEDLVYLEKATSVDLSGCMLITSDGLKSLTKVTKIELSGCHKITDEGLKSLKEAITVDLSFGPQITDEGLKSLTQAKEVNLSGNNDITDKGLESLKEATTVILRGCHKITDQGVAHLEKVKVLNIEYCENVSVEAQEALRARGVQVASYNTLWRLR